MRRNENIFFIAQSLGKVVMLKLVLRCLKEVDAFDFRTIIFCGP